jgi:hypothetical protein
MAIFRTSEASQSRLAGEASFNGTSILHTFYHPQLNRLSEWHRLPLSVDWLSMLLEPPEPFTALPEPSSGLATSSLTLMFWLRTRLETK